MTDDTKERELWLSYIGKLNDRALNRQRASGFTAWAVMAVIVALCLKILPNIPFSLADPVQRSFHLLATTVICIFIFFFFFFIMSSVVSHADSDEARLQSRIQRASEPIVYTSMSLFLGALSILSYNCTIVASTYFMRVWPFWVFTVFFGLMTIFAPFVFSSGSLKHRRHADKLKKLSSSTSLMSPKDKQIQKRASCLTFFAGTCIALVPIVEALPRLSDDSRIAIVTWAAATCGVVYLSLFMIFRITGLSKDRFLSQLERDIIVNSLSADEIKKRYIQELLGEDLNSWLTNLVETAQMSKKECEHIVTEATQEILKIKQIDPSLRFEIAGRYEQVKNTIKSALHNCEEQHNQLLAQIDVLRKQSPVTPFSRTHPLDKHKADCQSNIAHIQRSCNDLIESCKPPQMIAEHVPPGQASPS